MQSVNNNNPFFDRSKIQAPPEFQYLMNPLAKMLNIFAEGMNSKNTEESEPNDASDSSDSSVSDVVPMKPEEKRMAPQQQRVLCRELLHSLKWNKKYEALTVRQAILKELVLSFKADPKNEASDFYLICICKLLNPKIVNAMPDLKELKNGSKMEGLLKMTSELDVCIADICTESEVKRQPDFDISVSLIAECEDLYMSLAHKVLARVKNLQKDVDESLKSQVTSTGQNIHQVANDGKVSLAYRKMQYYPHFIQNKCCEIKKTLLDYFQFFGNEPEYLSIKSEVLSQKLRRIEGTFKSRLKSLEEAIKSLCKFYATTSCTVNMLHTFGQLTGTIPTNNSKQLTGIFDNFEAQFQSREKQFSGMSTELKEFQNKMQKFLNAAIGHLERMRKLSQPQDNEKNNAYKWIASIDLFDDEPKKAARPKKDEHPKKTVKNKAHQKKIGC